MEATGAYWLGLARAMHESSAIVSVVNPSRTALFARSQLRRTKTDAVDAEMLAEFCQSQNPGPWRPPAPEILELRALLTYREHLIGEQIRFKQLASELHIGAKLKRLHTQQLKTIAEMLAEIDQQIRGLIEAHAPLQKAVDALCGVKGIGLLTAAALVAKLPAHRLRDAKAAAAYVGLTPSERQSGTSVHGKPRICKTGSSSLRRDLYMPAIAAMRFNPVLRDFAERLRANGKHPKAIIAAVMRKLVVLAFRLIRDSTKATPIAV
jgi:transposase